MIKLSEVAVKLKGTLTGDDLELTGLSTPESQTAETICIIATNKYMELMNGAAAAYVLPEDMTVETSKPYIKVKNIRLALVTLLNIFAPVKARKTVISKKSSIADSVKYGEYFSIGDFAVIGENTVIGNNVTIYANVVIGDNCKIGDNCVLHPCVVLYDNTELRNNVIIHAGTVIGGDGFGYVPSAQHVKIPHIGNVIIEEHVEIGTNSSIDRATIGSTVIGAGCKIDNQVQIAHNVQMGKGCLVASQVGISGSAKIGDYVIMGGQAGVADHAVLGSNISLAAKSGAMGEMAGNQNYGGAPALPAKEWAKSIANVNRLGELKKRVSELEKKVEGIK